MSISPLKLLISVFFLLYFYILIRNINQDPFRDFAKCSLGEQTHRVYIKWFLVKDNTFSIQSISTTHSFCAPHGMACLSWEILTARYDNTASGMVSLERSCMYLVRQVYVPTVRYVQFVYPCGILRLSIEILTARYV